MRVTSTFTRNTHCFRRVNLRFDGYGGSSTGGCQRVRPFTSDEVKVMNHVRRWRSGRTNPSHRAHRGLVATLTFAEGLEWGQDNTRV